MSKRILVVDDSMTLRQMLSFTLEKEGYDVIQASTGFEALEKARSRDIDLIICDFLMPGMTGVEFLKRARMEPGLRFKPVIMLTTEQEGTVKEDARSLGVRIWKVKPFDPQDILLSIRKLIRPESTHMERSFTHNKPVMNSQ